MLKTLVSLTLCTFLVLFYMDEKNVILPAFHMTNSPEIISQGHYGHSLLVEVSYSHDGFDEWIQSITQPYPLFLVDIDWLQRSETTIKLLLEKQIPVGLLGRDGSEYIETDLLTEQLRIFEQVVKRKPLWFATADYELDAALQQQLFAQEINVIAPSVIFSSIDMQLTDGDFVAIPLHRGTPLSFEELTQFQKLNSFLSIEENLFGYRISTKRYP